MGVGIGVVIAFTLLYVVDGAISQDIPALVFDDPQFARVEADYDWMDNRLAVFLYFTDTDGNNVKADGTGRITVTELDFDGNKVGKPYSYEVEFEKDGFQTWVDSSGLGLKQTAHAFYINQEFAGKGLWWDVSMEITLEDGSYWADVDNRFVSAD